MSLAGGGRSSPPPPWRCSAVRAEGDSQGHPSEGDCGRRAAWLLPSLIPGPPLGCMGKSRVLFGPPYQRSAAVSLTRSHSRFLWAGLDGGGGGRPPSLGPQPQHTGFLSMSVGMATGTDTRSRVRGPGDSLFWVMAGTPGLRRPGLLQAGLCPPLFTHDQPFPPWPPPLSSLGARSSWRDSPWDFRTDGLKR